MLTRCRKPGINALANHAPLELCNRGQDEHLQFAGWIAFARVDSLGRCDQCRAMSFELE
jgi:hypothetical protein